MVKTLKENGHFKLLEYDNNYFAVDYVDDSVGTSLIFSQDKEKVEEKYEEIVKQIKLF